MSADPADRTWQFWTTWTELVPDAHGPGAVLDTQPDGTRTPSDRPRPRHTERAQLHDFDTETSARAAHDRLARGGWITPTMQQPRITAIRCFRPGDQTPVYTIGNDHPITVKPAVQLEAVR